MIGLNFVGVVCITHITQCYILLYHLIHTADLPATLTATQTPILMTHTHC